MFKGLCLQVLVNTGDEREDVYAKVLQAMMEFRIESDKQANLSFARDGFSATRNTSERTSKHSPGSLSWSQQRPGCRALGHGQLQQGCRETRLLYTRKEAADWLNHTEALEKRKVLWFLLMRETNTHQRKGSVVPAAPQFLPGRSKENDGNHVEWSALCLHQHSMCWKRSAPVKM